MFDLSPEESLFVAALQSLPIAAATTDVRGTIRSINAALTALTGYTPKETVGQPITLLSSGTPESSFPDIIRQAIRSREPWRGERICRRKAGDIFTAEQTITSIESRDGQILRVVVTIQEVACVRPDGAERTGVDLLAIEAQRDFELFFNLIPDLACIVSTDGYFKKVNPAWEATLGYTREEVLATPMIEFIHPDDLERTVNEVAKQSREYRTSHFVNRYRCKDGSYRIFDWRTTFNRDDSTRFGIARDITEQRLWEQSLRESEERFRIMADSCPTIIWMSDAMGKTRLTNRICREFFGTTFEQADHDQSRLLIHPGDHSAYVGKFLFALRERASFRAEARVRRSDGEWRWIASHAEPRLSLNGEFLGHVGISLDITDRKQSEEALQKAKDAAEAANRAKGEFLANMSHEIRTPMNGVIGLTELALDTDLTAEQRGYLEDVKNSADSLLRILNDILDFSKIEAGKLEFEVIEFDLRQTVESILKVLGIRATAKNLELACDFDSLVPGRVLGDPGRLRQILINLTGNAIKFTERGEVVIRVERSSETAEDVELHFSVKDTGIGIPLNKRQYVFGAFSQADSSLTRTFGGTGLGLTISSQLAEMMGGRIWVESEEGRGSTFHFTVHLGLVPPRPEEERQAVSGFLDGLPVLVVDDNDTSRRILDKLLSHRGLKTALADSGPAALKALQDASESGNPFKLIVLDASMPGIDGFTLTQRIQANPHFGGAKIALLTSGAQCGAAGRCQALGVSACLVKPVGEMELLEAIARMWQPAVRTETQPDPSPHHVAQTEEVEPSALACVDDNR
jgi:PAS domain S-box-containing protein